MTIGIEALDAELLGRRPERPGAAQRSSARALIGAVLALLLLLTGVPLLPGSAAPRADAVIPGSVTTLPSGFTPRMINEQGWVVGFKGPNYSIWKPDGTLTDITTISGHNLLGFDDQGRLLVTASGGLLEIWSDAGSTVLAKPTVAGQDRSLSTGYGPDVNGRTVGIFPWVQSVSSNAVSYQGAGAPQLITALSTVMRGAADGRLFGMLPGGTARYAYLDGNQVTEFAGFGTGTNIVQMANDGYLLAYRGGVPQVLRNGSAQTITGVTAPVAINGEGAVVGLGSGFPGPDTSSFPVLFRSPTGEVRQLLEITGDATFKTLANVVDINDQCQVLGTGTVQGTPAVTRGFVADVPNCASDVFDASLEVSDGGAVLNREVELTLTLSSEASSPVEDLALGFGGVGISAPAEDLEIVSGPEPAPPGSLGANDTTSVTYRVIPKKPGTLSIDAAATGTRDGTPIEAETTLELDVATAGIGGAFFRTDNKAPFVKVGEPAPVRLRLANETGEDLTSVTLVDVRVVPDELSDGAGELDRDGPGVRGTLAGTGLESLDFVDYELRGQARGGVLLQADVTAKDESGDTVEATIESRFEVREDRLKIEISLDPEEYTFPDDLPPGEDPPPLPVTSSLTFTNTGEVPLEDIRLLDLDVVRTFSGQELYVTYKDGVRPDPLDPAIVLEELAPGETSEPFLTNWEATDDGEVIFKASATSVDSEGEEARGIVEQPWKAKPSKYLEITTEVVNPPGDELLDAGGQIIVNGTIENLSNTASLEVGPLYPELTGNTGTMNVAYADDDQVAQAPNPRSPVEAPPLELAPGQRKNFQVRVTTNYSESRAFGVGPTGGTRAELRFEPWAIATELDGTESIVQTYVDNQPGQEADGGVKATADDLLVRVSIDDSIELPDTSVVAAIPGFVSGTVEGLLNAAIAGIYGIVDVVKMPVTFLAAAFEYQTKVWSSFTEEEKEQFLTETSFLIVSVLKRNVELGLQDAGELYDQVYGLAGTMLTDLANEWETGDFNSTARSYGAFFGETVGSVAGPLLLNKLATSPKAVAALERAQIALQARMAPVLNQVAGIRSIEGVLPLLRALESGTELTPGEIATLYGVTPDEIAVYQELATRYGYLLTIRSRHASSIRWIEKFGAMLKPEAIKIKSVSELDVKLGYRLEDLGSIVFKKPEVLKTLPEGASPQQVDAAIKSFVQSKGFSSGSKDHAEAVKRIEKRIKEWDKYEAEYKSANRKRHIRTDFNYTGNGITDYRSISQRKKLTGFRMIESPQGSEQYVIELLDPKVGKYKRVTGDIDPIAFTKADGTPLNEYEHRQLVDALMNSPVGAEHPESATYVEGGLDFILDQFKPGEPGLQIGPDGVAPRVVRFDKARSVWNDPRSYRLHWEGGFTGTEGGRTRVTPAPVDAQFGRVPLADPVGVPSALPTAVGVATVGRCNVEVLNQAPPAPAEGPTAVYVGADGFLTQIGADGTEAPSPLHDTCFSEGAADAIRTAPTSQLAEPTEQLREVQASAVALEHGAAARSIAAGSTTVVLATSEGFTGTGGSGFVAGQGVIVGAGTDRAEQVTIASVTATSLTFTAPLARSHEPGEVVIMVRAADGSEVTPPTTTTTAAPTTTTTATAPVDDDAAVPVDDGTLPRTGSDLGLVVLVGLVLVAIGVGVRRSARWGIRPSP